MKTLYKIRNKIIRSIILVFLTVGCSESWLEPNPLSFYSASNTYDDISGLESTLMACLKTIRGEWENTALMADECDLTEAYVKGITDKTIYLQNINQILTPDGDLHTGNRIGYYWDRFYKGIKDANVVIAHINDPTDITEEERNEVLGKAYFLRAYFYYRLTHQFGDIPFIWEECVSPKLDYYTYTRESILQKMKKDLESAEQWTTNDVSKGDITKGAVQHLLTKVNLSLGEFDDAIRSASDLINSGDYSIMTARFGSDKDDPSRNVTWDLHRPVNKSIAANKEAVMLTIDRLNEEGNTDAGTELMRITTPLWWNSINTPAGNRGTIDSYNIEYDQVTEYGRGIGTVRTTNYSSRYIWRNCGNDYRHAEGNWMEMEDLVYNNPSLVGLGDPYYGEPLQLYNDQGQILCTDTIRNWFPWPYYKVDIPDPEDTKPRGGHSDWYVFRLAETYLLRAEAYVWQQQYTNAANDLNVVRARANAEPIPAGEINIGVVLDERARELFYEEPRKTELTRIAYIFAKTGIMAENGKTYSLANFSDDNYYYDRVMEYNEFYNRGVFTNSGVEFTISPYHVLWPIPAYTINANTQGVINQNKGYAGYENNIVPLEYEE